MNINARSLLFMAQRVAPLMEQRGGGAIVSLTSPGLRACCPITCGGCEQGCLEALTRYLAVEFVPRISPSTRCRRGWC